MGKGEKKEEKKREKKLNIFQWYSFCLGKAQGLNYQHCKLNHIPGTVLCFPIMTLPTSVMHNKVHIWDAHMYLSNKIYSFCVYKHFASIYVCESRVCMVPARF